MHASQIADDATFNIIENVNENANIIDSQINNDAVVKSPSEVVIDISTDTNVLINDTKNDTGGDNGS